MSKIVELAEMGQAIWLDYIRRSFVANGELQTLIDRGLRGITSNPSIFEKAIAGNTDYDADLEEMVRAGKSADEIYLALTVADIQHAADLLRPVYNRTEGADGYVSLEVSPTLAHDTEGTVTEARRLWALVNRPNLMIKIPATKAGLPAITLATGDGINVNVTLIFSLSRYGEVMAAYLAGLHQRLNAGQPVDTIASVASFFISRMDSKVDKRLEEIRKEGGLRAELAASLLGTAAVANAKAAYQQFRSVFESETFAPLQAAGAHLQRPLWASTSTKNPAYPDIKYVQELIGSHTVNTLPQETLEAFVDHGEVRATLEEDLDEANVAIQSLADLGISLEDVADELEAEGVASFAKSFQSLMASITEKRSRLLETLPGGASPANLS